MSYRGYKGKFKPKNFGKYWGDPTKITYRSLLERRFMCFCDDSPAIIKWNSEEVIIPYLSPIDNRYHRYYVDFLIKTKTKTGQIKTTLIEVKPHSQTSPPVKKSGSKKPTRTYIKEAMTWGVNEAKWKAATEFCLDRKWQFKIITEKDLTP